MGGSPRNAKVPTGAPVRLSRGWIIASMVLLVGYLLLKPTLEEKLGMRLPGFGETYEQQQEPRPEQTGRSLPASEDTITEREPAPESRAPTSPEPEVVASTPEVTDFPSPSECVPAPATTAKPAEKPPQPESTQASRTTTPAEPALGQLREIGRKVFVSTAGLHYRPGSADGHRLDHIMRHAEDDLSKPVHGVFLGDRDAILKLIDEAYLIALKRGPPQVIVEDEDDRTVYTVDMKKKIGYVGGEVGQRKKKPACTKLRIVLEGTNVITAFPTDR